MGRRILERIERYSALKRTARESCKSCLSHNSMLAAGLVLALGAAVSAQGNFLKADGIYLRNGNGKGDTAWLFGVNFGGLFVHEPWMSPLAGANSEWDSRTLLIQRFGAVQAQKLLDTYWDSWATAADFKNMAAEGLNCVRMPVYFLDYMDDNGVWRKDSAGNIDFHRIDRLVADAKQAGVYTVLDLHGAPGSQNGNQHSGKQTGANLYTTARYQEMFVDFWATMAAHFKDENAVAGYDLLNEPSQNFPSAMGQNVVDLYDRAYKAIRKVDDNHVIFMEATWTWNLLPDPAAKGWSNVSYSLHYYKWEQNGDYAAMKTFLDQKFTDAKKWGVQYKVPHFAGEFTLFTNPQVWDYGMTRMAKEDWHWTIWSYKVTGNGSSWGLYTSKETAPNTPNVQTDSYDQILQKWGRWNTANYFTRNPMVGDVLKKVAAFRKTVRPSNVPVGLARSAQSNHVGADLAVRVSGGALVATLPHSGPWAATLRNLQGAIVREAAGTGNILALDAKGLENGVYTLTVAGAAVGPIRSTRILFGR